MPDHFTIDYDGAFTLTVEQIWPDGDAPENPTVEDVCEKMEREGSVRNLLDSWALHPESVFVNGTRVNLR